MHIRHLPCRNARLDLYWPRLSASTLIYVQYLSEYSSVFRVAYARYNSFLGKRSVWCKENNVLNGQPVLNDYECPLVSLTKNVCTVDCKHVMRAVSLVHNCTDGCTFEERDTLRKIEQKLTKEKTYYYYNHFKHDCSNMMCVIDCNVFCIVFH